MSTYSGDWVIQIRDNLPLPFQRKAAICTHTPAPVPLQTTCTSGDRPGAECRTPRKSGPRSHDRVGAARPVPAPPSGTDPQLAGPWAQGCGPGLPLPPGREQGWVLHQRPEGRQVKGRVSWAELWAWHGHRRAHSEDELVHVAQSQPLRPRLWLRREEVEQPPRAGPREVRLGRDGQGGRLAVLTPPPGPLQCLQHPETDPHCGRTVV